MISSNNDIDHELTILSLHLVQSALVYINTLLLQQIIKEELCRDILTIEDKRAITPLFNYPMFQQKKRLIITMMLCGMHKTSLTWY